jgi:hypothetical protein
MFDPKHRSQSLLQKREELQREELRGRLAAIKAERSRGIGGDR